MTTDPFPKVLRLWPGVAGAALAVAGILLPLVAPSTGFVGMLIGMVGGLIVALWWLLASRAPWLERVAGLALMPAAALAVRQLAHPTIQHAGMGKMMYFLSIPFLGIALVAWAAASRRLPK